MARVVKSSKIKKRRIKETQKELKRRFKKTGLSRREAREQAKATAGDVYEARRQQKIAENKAKSQAKASAAVERKQKQQAADAKFKADKQKAEQVRLKGNPENRVTVGGKTYTSQAAADAAKAREESKKSEERTKRGLGNIKARRSVDVGEVYERTNPDGTKKKVIKRDQSKPSQQQNKNQKPSAGKSEFGKTFAEERRKQGAGGEFDFKGKKYTTNLKKEKKRKTARDGGALAIMIAPVKTKKMKAVKKAPGGASMKKKKMSMYADGGKMPKYMDGGKLKEVPSKAKGLSKLPKSVRNKMGYMKNGGKLKDKMMYGGSMKKAMYGAKMKKKAMYGAKMKK